MLNDRKWRLDKDGYAIGWGYENGKRKLQKMHRVIMNAQKSQIVDHINGNRTDNRKHNLRFCNARKNAQNKRVPKNKNGSKYKGVTKSGNKFRARIRVNGVNLSIGSFSTEIEACKSYNYWAKHYFGEFARINEIEPKVQSDNASSIVDLRDNQ